MLHPPVVLIAASGLAREVSAALQALGRTVSAVLDDDSTRFGCRLHGIEVLGGIDRADKFTDAEFVVCAGSGSARRSLVQRLAAQGIGERRFASVIHPRASVGLGSDVGTGSVLLAGVVLTGDVQVGQHVVAMPNVVMTHDCRVQDFVTLCAGVTLGGSVQLSQGAYLGMSASIREGIVVGSDAVLGMGAVLLSNLPARQTWAGVPAGPLSAGRS